MFTVFTIMRQLHELLWYLTEALTLSQARALHAELGVAFDHTERLTRSGPDELVELDVAAHRDRANPVLLRASGLVRAEAPGQPVDHPEPTSAAASSSPSSRSTPPTEIP